MVIFSSIVFYVNIILISFTLHQGLFDKLDDIDLNLLLFLAFDVVKEALKIQCGSVCKDQTSNQRSGLAAEF